MAVADDVGMIANAQRLAHVVVGDQNANAARLEVTNDALNLNNGNRINAGKGFVQQDKPWLCGQRPRNFNPPPLASGQSQRGRVAQMINPQVF